jgi:hypothetical protein
VQTRRLSGAPEYVATVNCRGRYLTPQFQEMLEVCGASARCELIVVEELQRVVLKVLEDGLTVIEGGASRVTGTWSFESLHTSCPTLWRSWALSM